MNTVTLAFLPKPIMVDIKNLLPSRKIAPGVSDTRKYKQIRASIEEVDLIEPLSVTAVDRKSGQHFLLDGHMRLLALQDLGYSDIPCLVATTDESFTYNNRVNRLSSVQEHIMIRRAVDRGVSPERLAKALCVDASQIIKKMNLLDGICKEATELLKDRQFSTEIALCLRKMKPTRQVECAELMISANNMTIAYVRALLRMTPEEMLSTEKKVKTVPKGVSQVQLAQMEKEMSNVEGQYKLAEQNYSEDMLNLVVARGYLSKLVGNPQVTAYLGDNHAEVLEQFRTIIEATSGETAVH